MGVAGSALSSSQAATDLLNKCTWCIVSSHASVAPPPCWSYSMKLPCKSLQQQYLSSSLASSQQFTLGQKLGSGSYISTRAIQRQVKNNRHLSFVMRFGGGGNDKNSGEESPETLFMKELAKRGTPPLGKESGALGTDTKTKEEEVKNASSASSSSKWKDEREQTDQRQRSMALNSEGLDGLIPRGQELVKLGGTFWLSFWPLIAASLAAFVASYLYFGSSFVHTGNRSDPPPYVDPFQLLEGEELPSQVGPNRVPFDSYRAPQ